MLLPGQSASSSPGFRSGHQRAAVSDSGLRVRTLRGTLRRPPGTIPTLPHCPDDVSPNVKTSTSGLSFSLAPPELRSFRICGHVTSLWHKHCTFTVAGIAGPQFGTGRRRDASFRARRRIFVEQRRCSALPSRAWSGATACLAVVDTTLPRYRPHRREHSAPTRIILVTFFGKIAHS